MFSLNLTEDRKNLKQNYENEKKNVYNQMPAWVNHNSH